jgi:L-lactate dehydrogenase (cytochrome)
LPCLAGGCSTRLANRIVRLDRYLIIKGILSAAGTHMARDYGVDGITVSNHGDRQLDDVVSPLTVLQSVVEVCPDPSVMIDGGIRRGSDVLKALALDARAVLVGWSFACVTPVARRA